MVIFLFHLHLWQDQMSLLHYPVNTVKKLHWLIYIYNFEKYWSVSLFSCNVFIWFGDQDPFILISTSLLSYHHFIESFVYWVHVLFFSFFTCVAILIVYCTFRMIHCRGSKFCLHHLKNVDFLFYKGDYLTQIPNSVSSAINSKWNLQCFSLTALAFHWACWSLPHTSAVQELAKPLNGV